DRQYLSRSVAAQLLWWRKCSQLQLRPGPTAFENARSLLRIRRREPSIVMLANADKTIQERPFHTPSPEACRGKLEAIPILHATVAALPAQLIGTSAITLRGANPPSKKARPADACKGVLPLPASGLVYPFSKRLVPNERCVGDVTCIGWSTGCASRFLHCVDWDHRCTGSSSTDILRAVGAAKAPLLWPICLYRYSTSKYAPEGGSMASSGGYPAI
ncbi:hypothetical protein CCMA1212_003524, partial [Trichoderma ghanense]